MSQVIAALAAIPLFEAAVLHGVRVVRTSLLGFQIEGRGEILDAAEVAARLEAPRRSRRAGLVRRATSARIVVCGRCGGDGLGRRNRGVCGLCHGPGIQASLPWRDGGGLRGGSLVVSPEEVTAVIDQALAALRAAAYPRARESLVSVLGEALRLAPASVQERALGELRGRGFEAAAEVLAAAAPAPRAA